MRLIDADALKKLFEKRSETDCFGCAGVYCLSCIIDNVIDDIPTVDAMPVVHSRWIKERVCSGGFRQYTGIDNKGETHTISVDERVTGSVLFCPECGARSADNWFDYCPNCGAKMDGERK
jgi:hypothetical protein